MATMALMPKGNADLYAITKRPSLLELQNTIGITETATVIFSAIKNFCEGFNVVRNMEQYQMNECALIILNEYPLLRVEDFLVMFSMAKIGKLDFNGGKGIMDRIDIQIIMNIVKCYIEYYNSNTAVLNEKKSDEAAMLRLKQRREKYAEETGKPINECGKMVDVNLTDLVTEIAAQIKIEQENEENIMLEEMKRLQRKKEKIAENVYRAYGITKEELDLAKSATVKIIESKINKPND